MFRLRCGAPQSSQERERSISVEPGARHSPSSPGAQLRALREALQEYELNDEVGAKLYKKFDSLVHELVTSQRQLEAVGGKVSTLTKHYRQTWDENAAELATLEADVLTLAIDENQEKQMLVHDSVTLNKRKAFYGLVLGELQKHRGLHRIAASADMDYFKLVNDLWSHDHGDFAIILAGQEIRKTVAKWNLQAKQDATGHCIAFRFGGDEFVFLFAFAVGGGAAESAARELLDEVRKKVTDSVRKHFKFATRDKEKLKDRSGDPIKAKGPAISIGVSSVLPPTAGSDKVVLHKMYLEADAVLKAAKPGFKEGEGACGGVSLKSDWLRDIGLPLRELAALLRDQNPSRAASAAADLFQAAVKGEDEKRAICEVDGCLEALVALLTAGSAEGKENAAGALQTLASGSDERTSRVAAQSGCLEALVALLEAGSAVGKEKAAGALRNLASGSDERKNRVAEQSGCLEALVALLKAGSEKGKLIAAGALQNLASGSEESKSRVAAQSGCLEALVALLEAGSAVGKENAAGALCTLAIGSDERKSRVAAQSGCLEALVALLKAGSAVGKLNAAAALKNLASGSEESKNRVAAQSGCLEALVALLEAGSAAGKENAAEALKNLASGSDERKSRVAAQSGCLEALEALRTAGSAAGTGALRALGPQ